MFQNAIAFPLLRRAFSTTSTLSSPAATRTATRAASATKSLSKQQQQQQQPPPQQQPQTAIMFPGQGCQQVGMGSSLADSSQIARETFAEMDEVLGVKLSELMFGGEQAELNLTFNAQPAILAHSIAVWRTFMQSINLDNIDKFCGVALGHSLGEYTALVAANAISFPDAIRLVRQRGLAMHVTTPPLSTPTSTSTSPTAFMCAVMPINHIMAKYLCHEASLEAGGEVCCVANVNSYSQVVLSGTPRAIEVASQLAKQNYGVMKVVNLDVSAPFHSPLMSQAQSIIQPLISALNIVQPNVPVILNDSAVETQDVETIRSSLIDHMTSPVLWSNSVKRCERMHNVTFWIEFGNGPVLAPLTQRCIPLSKRAICISSTKDIENFIQQKERKEAQQQLQQQHEQQNEL